jgi:hypothetical protein
VQRLVQLTAAPSCLALELTRTNNLILCSYNARMFPTIVVSRLLLLLLLLLIVVVVVVVVVVQLVQLVVAYLDDWLTMHRSITLVDLQLDAQNVYLFTYNSFIKILYMF